MARWPPPPARRLVQAKVQVEDLATPSMSGVSAAPLTLQFMSTQSDDSGHMPTKHAKRMRESQQLDVHALMMLMQKRT